MAWRNQLRDRVEIQTMTETDNGAGGFTIAWKTDLRVRCRISNMSSRELKTYGRDGFENGYTVHVSNPIPTTNGFTRLYDFLNDIARERARILYRGLRTLTIVGFASPDQGVFGTAGDMLSIVVVETPRSVGVIDA